VLGWQQGQPIPQGWRLGHQGFLKPVFVPPSNLSNWQQGQAIPEGYRLNKRGTLRPLNYFQWWTSTYGYGGLANQTTNVLPAQVEFREKPAVVQEVIKPGLREEIQPVIHRDREQLEIREEIQPIYERSVRPTIVEQRQLAPEIKPELRMGAAPVMAAGPQSSVVVEPEHREAVMHAPVVEEVVRKKIIEEVQPVIHREVIAPKVIHETRPIYEKIVEAPVVTYTTLPARVLETPIIAAPPPPAEVTTVTTTVTETQFIPQNTGLLQKGMQNMNLGAQNTTPAFVNRQ
jgi:uncharacterized protein YbdZ (MbtH family)